MSTIKDEIQASNAKFSKDYGSTGGLSPNPAKKTAILTCMDTRIDSLKFSGLVVGDAHIIRNAGGRASDDAIRSLIISHKLLGTDQWFVIHHTDCGMLTFKDDALKAQIEEDTGLRPPFALEAFSDPENDVRQSVRRIQSSPFVPHKDNIRGFVYDVETGRLNEVVS